MGKKIIRLTENEFANLILKGLIGTDPNKFLENLLSSQIPKKEKEEILKDVNLDDIPKDVYDKVVNKLGSSSGESDKGKTQGELAGRKLDLNDNNHYNAYVKICDKFINSRSVNLLGITGTMLADGAKMAYNKYGVYVPPELVLAQLAQEGGFSSDRTSRPIKTKNPFNVGNVDSGANVFHSSVQSGINRYYDLIAGKYLGKNKTAENLYHKFVNLSGNRYATDPNYETKIKSIADSVKNISEPIYASIGVGDRYTA
jgi:hypothetical protein